MSNAQNPSRSHLPIPSRERTGSIAYDAKDPDAGSPKIEPLRPPQGAPNVLIVLLDDAGFGAPSAFGGPCQTPSAEELGWARRVVEAWRTLDGERRGVLVVDGEMIEALHVTVAGRILERSGA